MRSAPARARVLQGGRGHGAAPVADRGPLCTAPRCRPRVGQGLDWPGVRPPPPSPPLARLLDLTRRRGAGGARRALAERRCWRARRPTPRPGVQALSFHVLRWLGGATEAARAAGAEDPAAERRRPAGHRPGAAVADRRAAALRRPHPGRPGRGRRAPPHAGGGRLHQRRAAPLPARARRPGGRGRGTAGGRLQPPAVVDRAHQAGLAGTLAGAAGRRPTGTRR